MARMVFDTETTSLNKPFCYDVGYTILDDDWHELCRKHFVVEQTWHNLPLFESAYYKDKRPKYVALMRSRQAKMMKYGYIMQEMKRDMDKYNVTDVYAYNSQFDDDVFTFNCDWFKCMNPLDDTPIHDIWGYVSEFISNTKDYRNFCEQHQYFTDTGNYKASAEIVFRYLSQDLDFEEAHMGLYDVDIEAAILQYCIQNGAKPDYDYKVTKILKRPTLTPYTIKVNGQIIHQGVYEKKYSRNDTYNFTEPGE